MSLHAMRTTAGFTVTELMITLAVIAVMTGLAAPAFTDFVKNERLVDEANSFILAFILARTESIKRNRRVTLCKSANPDAVTPACTTAGDSNWEDGYIMFTDGNPNAAGGAIAADAIFQPVAPNLEVLIRAQRALSGDVTIRPHPDNAALIGNYVSYNPRGLVRQTNADGAASQSGVFRICDDRGLPDVRTVSLSRTGRVRVVSGPVAEDRAGACP